jgi:hypothetical protein
MRMRFTGDEESRAGSDVEPAATGRVELNRLAGDQEQWRIGGAVADGLSQIGECLAQVVLGHGLRLVGPQQLGECRTHVWSGSFDDQIDQQRPDLGGFEASYWSAIAGNLQRPEDRYRQTSHPDTPE